MVLAAVTRGSAREIVLVNRSTKVAEAVATDLRYGTPLGPRLEIAHGDAVGHVTRATWCAMNAFCTATPPLAVHFRGVPSRRKDRAGRDAMTRLARRRSVQAV